MSPPTFRFYSPLFHPNVYKSGRLCISILHAPGEDEMSGELASERWSPAQRIFTVLLSILSLLDDAEPSSPANVEAAVMLRKDPEEYKRRAKETAERSRAEMEEGVVWPEEGETGGKKGADEDERSDDGFWADSEDEIFEGDDTEGDMEFGECA